MPKTEAERRPSDLQQKYRSKTGDRKPKKENLRGGTLPAQGPHLTKLTKLNYAEWEVLWLQAECVCMKYAL